LKIKNKSKLVRDKIPEIIFKKEEKYFFHIADEKEFEKRLKDKLKEEVDEFCEKLDKEELADIFEVFDTICKIKKYSKSLIIKIQNKKRLERGSFNNKIILDKY
jgi:predicted house-cleaning noncanonical NTP pyrophosphatase (MazG superfamily)